MSIAGTIYEQRLWERYVVTPNGCWEWTGTRDQGYGYLGVKEGGVFRNRRAHRLAYELLRGPIPVDLELDHLCRNRACLNPDHLEIVTNVQNVMRGYSLPAQNARKTHCPQGHPFDAANTYLSPRGRRKCRTCQTAREQRRVRLRAGRKPAL